MPIQLDLTNPAQNPIVNDDLATWLEIEASDTLREEWGWSIDELMAFQSRAVADFELRSHKKRGAKPKDTLGAATETVENRSAVMRHYYRKKAEKEGVEPPDWAKKRSNAKRPKKD